MKRLFFIFLICSLIEAAQTSSLWAQPADADHETESIIFKGIDSLKTRRALEHAFNACNAFIQKHEKSSEKKPLVALAHLLKGQILRRIDRARMDFAIEELKNGLLLAPESPELNRELGIIYADMDKFGDARKHIQKSADLNRTDHRAWQALIDLNEKESSSDQRIEAFKGYLGANPEDARIWTKLGDEYLKIGKKEESESAFVEALKKNPRQTEAHLQLAKLKEEQSDWVGAIAEYNAILEYDQGNKAALDRLSLASPHFQHEQEINKKLTEAKIALKSNDPIQWEKARQDLESLPQTQEAIEEFQKARRKLYQYWFSEGLRNESVNTAQALDDFTTSLAYSDSEQEREQAFAKQKDTAFKLGKKVEARNAKEAAQLALKSRKFGEAVKKFTVAAELDSSLGREILPAMRSAEISMNFRRGLDALAKKQYGRAKSYFEMTLEENPNYPDAREKYLEAARLDSVQIFSTLYQQAKAKRDWHTAHSSLSALLALAPDSVQYAQELKIVEREIWENTIWFIIGIFGRMLVVIILILALYYSRKVIVNTFRMLVALLHRLPYKKFTLPLTVGAFIFGIFFIIVYFGPSIMYSLQSLQEWANHNEGMLTFIGLLSSCVLWLIARVIKTQKPKEQAVKIDPTMLKSKVPQNGRKKREKAV